MSYVNESAFAALREVYDKVNVIDVGAARYSFMTELEKVYARSDIFALGVDPINHQTKDDEDGPIVDESHDHYDLFMHAGIDNVESPTHKMFYVNSDDQTSSFSELILDNLSSDECDDDKFWYPSGIIDTIKNISHTIEKIPVYPLEDVINQHMPEGLIHFIKVDAEGKDLEVVKSISDETLRTRVKFICIECPNRVPRFEGETIKPECIDYMKSKNFNVFTDMDYENDSSNRTPMSDVVFVNGEEL